MGTFLVVLAVCCIVLMFVLMVAVILAVGAICKDARKAMEELP